MAVKPAWESSRLGRKRGRVLGCGWGRFPARLGRDRSCTGLPRGIREGDGGIDQDIPVGLNDRISFRHSLVTRRNVGLGWLRIESSRQRRQSSQGVLDQRRPAAGGGLGGDGRGDRRDAACSARPDRGDRLGWLAKILGGGLGGQRIQGPWCPSGCNGGHPSWLKGAPLRQGGGLLGNFGNQILTFVAWR